MSGTHHNHEEHGHEGVNPSAKAGRHAARIRAIEALLVEKGVLAEEDVRRQIEYMEARSPANGARLVARAWVDPGFKALLLYDTKAAALELEIDASGPVEFVTVENTPEIHNLIVCTLWISPEIEESPYTTARQTYATSSCRCVRPARRA